MEKNISSIQQHIHGNKGNLVVSQLRSKNLENVMIIPIEVGKSQHKALIANYFGSIVKPSFEFHNSQEGIMYLHKTISAIFKHQPVEEILIGMEATGHYFKKSAALLNEMGYNNLFILNPLSTSYCRKAGLTWSKTDDIDLRAVGQSMISGYGNKYHPEAPIWEDLKESCRYRRFLIKQQTSFKNKIHCYFDLLLPGINELQIFADNYLWATSSLDFFTKYSTIDLIKQLNPTSIVKFFKRRGRNISFENAHKVIEWSKIALNPCSPANDSRQFVFKDLIEQLRHISERIRQIEIQLAGYLVQTPAVLLLSIDYIGPIRAAEFAGESAPIDQYPKSGALIKAAGLDSTKHQSAASESSDHSISKKGSRRLRYISIKIADDLMKRNQHFVSYVKELINKGKSKDCACIATACRFIRIAFWMLKEQKSFKPADGLGVSKDPLDKIKTFLRQHQASDLSEKYIAYAQKYFPERREAICKSKKQY